MFGKRSGSSEARALAPAARRRRPRRRSLRRAWRKARAAKEAGLTPFPSDGLGAPLVSAPPPSRAPLAHQYRAVLGRYAPFRDLLRGQGHHLRRADRGDRSGATGAARRQFGARGNPRHRQRDHRDQEHRDVDLRAGRTARRHLQRRTRLRSARAAAVARRHRRHHGERLRHGLHRSQRQDSEDQHPVPRQPAAARTSASASSARSAAASTNPRRSATRACRTARASTPSCRRWRSTGPRSPFASSRRTS